MQPIPEPPYNRIPTVDEWRAALEAAKAHGRFPDTSEWRVLAKFYES